MKLVKEANKNSKTELITQYVKTAESYVVFAYLLCMLGIFPLFYREQYYKIGAAKFDFFWNTTLGFIGISIFITILKLLFSVTMKREKHEWDALKFLDKLSFLDYTVFLYTICVLLSYAFSNFKSFALKGAPGWEMGLCSQLMFIAVYFILSRQKMFAVWQPIPKDRFKDNICRKQKKVTTGILAIHLVSSSIAFGVGILHRFEIDPLGMYEGLNLNQKIEFLSTIGQATWFSSYVCSVFAVGVVLFYISEDIRIRVLSGIYTVISFAILVTQNSDSAFISILGIILLLGYFSLKDLKKWCRFWGVLCLMWGTFGGIGILQRIFADRAIPLDSLSTFFSQSVVTWIMFFISLIMNLFYKKSEQILLLNSKRSGKGEDNHEKWNVDRIMIITKRIYQCILFLLGAAVLIIIIFIYLNTKGYLFQWLGYRSSHQYLLFDYHWGSNRGSTWMICWQAFCGLPLFQKLFGVGPDSLSAYLYSVPEIGEVLHNLWGNIRLTNAHNEYLNSLLCYGMVGVTVWLSVIAGGISYFYKKAKEQPFMIAFALCIMGYACHNIFCYQQVCCTPFLFIVLGIGESLTKSENFNTIK